MNTRAWLGALALGVLAGITPAPSFASASSMPTEQWPGGGDDKKEKGGKKEKDEEDGQKATKVKFSPQKAAKLSAREARKNLKWKQDAISSRAKTRNFFHRTFNTKYGKQVNFRNKFTRNRWRKGHI